ncbi:MAG: hypothetical protein ACLFTG_01720 [Alphaproteobacteria bacterium]
MADGEQILLRRRETGDGFDVMYRPVPLGALLVGRDLDDAESFVGRTHDRDAVAHRVALARAWTGGNASASRRAAWALAVLAERARNEAARATVQLTGGLGETRLVARVEEAERALARALGTTASARGPLATDREEVAAAAGALETAFAAVVARLRDAEPAKALPDAPAGEVVAAAREAPAALLAELQDQLPALTKQVVDEPPLAAAAEGGGTGSAMTVAGRVTYGLRLAAGYVTAAGCTTPAARLFQPGGVAADLFTRLPGDARTLAVVVAALDPSLHWTLAGARADA